jgi:tRNA threonylcarbamoyladenosine biosynthesis protein TsaB
MLLAIDTATRAVSLALSDGQTILAESTWLTSNHHTVELTPALHDLLARAGVSPPNLTALAVTRGPGSYTGLRIGMSLAKGLALAASPPLPIISIPTLDVTAAAQPHLADRLCAVAQAGRKRINAGYYRWGEDEGWQVDSEPFITEWGTLLETITGTWQVAGEIDPAGREAVSHRSQVLVAPLAARLRRAGYLAQLAYRKLSAGQPADPALAAPVYLS